MEKQFDELAQKLGTRVKQGEPMNVHTTLRVGGAARLYIEVETIDDLVGTVSSAKQLGVTVVVIGGGSNAVVSSQGINGLVIKNNCRKIDVARMSGKIVNQQIDMENAYVSAESGAIMNLLVRSTVDEGLCGLEYQLGLPGTVGGAVANNASFAPTQSYVGDCLYNARILTKEGEVREVDGSYFAFGYDTSSIGKNGDIVLSVVFKLTPADKSLLWQRATEALNHRTSQQTTKYGVGCTFRNIAIRNDLEMPSKEAIEDAIILIQKAGLLGLQVGGVMLSKNHPNFVYNMGNGDASDVLSLVGQIKAEIRNNYGKDLHMEAAEVK